jgi:hypothetical protein
MRECGQTKKVLAFWLVLLPGKSSVCGEGEGTGMGAVGGDVVEMGEGNGMRAHLQELGECEAEQKSQQIDSSVK